MVSASYDPDDVDINLVSGLIFLHSQVEYRSWILKAIGVIIISDYKTLKVNRRCVVP